MARQAALKKTEAPDRGLAAEGARLRVLGSTWLDQVLEDFERSMLRRSLSPATVRTYRWAMQDLFEGLKAIGVRDITGLTREHLEDWQDHMLEERWKPRSRSLAVTAAKQMIRWAAERELLDFRLEKALARVKTPDGRPRPIPEADLAKIKAFLLPRRPRMSIMALRDRALFFYLLSTGARVSEALQVRRDDIDDPIVRQKGGTEKVLMMSPATKEMVEDYLRARRDESPWLWVTFKTNRPMGRLGPPGVREAWRRLAKKLDIKPFTTHQIRHTTATELLNAGVPELVIAEHLGHHGLGNLHIYSQVRKPQRQHAVDVMDSLITFRDRLPKIPPGPVKNWREEPA